MAVHIHGNLAGRAIIFHGKVQVVFLRHELPGRVFHPGGEPAVGLHHLVQVDVSEGGRRVVHQLQGRLLAEEFGDVPVGGLEGLRIAALAGAAMGGADHLPANLQLQLPLMAPTDQKTKMGTFDFEGQGSQGAGGAIATVFGGDELPPLKGLHRGLTGHRSAHRPRAERLARRRPVPELVAFKIGHHQVGPVLPAEEGDVGPARSTEQGKDRRKLHGFSQIDFSSCTSREESLAGPPRASSESERFSGFGWKEKGT